MKRFKDVFRFVSNKQPLNKDIGYYLDDRIVGREIETSFDFLKFIGVFYKIVSIIAIFFAITTFIESLNELSNNSYYNFFCIVIAPIIYLVIACISVHRDILVFDKLEKYKNNHWNFILTEIKSIRKGLFGTKVCFDGFENSVVLKNKYAKYLKENQKVYVITIEKDCSDILVIYDWNGESYRDRGFQVNKVNI